MKTLQDYQKALGYLLSWSCEKTEFQSEIPFEDILRQPRLVLALNHATALSWIPAMCLLTQKACEAGGGDRIPRGIVDRWFYTNPVFKWIAEQVTQSAEPQNFQDVIESFQNSTRTDLVLFPEGAQTFFGKATEIQEFRSVKFIEIAIRCQAPILIVAHKGSEVWSQSVQLPPRLGAFLGKAISPYSRFFSDALSKSNLLNLPFVTQRIPLFKMRCHLYVPALYESDLSGHESERKAQLEQEAEKIKEILREMLEIL